MRISSLAVYPVKSGAGISLPEVEVLPTGLAGDRRWMVVDEEGEFVSQRVLPALARLAATPTATGMRLDMGGEGIEVPVPTAGAGRIPVRVWKDRLDLPEADQAASWLSRHLGRPLRLVHQPEDAVREMSREWGREGDRLSLADGAPILVTTTASLEEVRRAVGSPVGMERFRPNIVVEADEPWAEDGWARLSLGGIELDLVKPCARCSVITTNQEQGVVDKPEVLGTLRTIRRSADARVPGVLFGWNAVPRGTGRLRVGDAVEVVGRRASWPIAEGRGAGRRKRTDP